MRVRMFTNAIYVFGNLSLLIITNFTNAESSFKCTYSNNTANFPFQKYINSDEFFTVVKLVKLVNWNFQKRRMFYLQPSQLNLNN